MSLACEFATARVLLYQQHQLLECQLGTGRVHAGDRAGMTGIDIAQVIEGLLGAQLRQQDAIRLHPQATLEQLLRSHSRHSLVVLRIKQAHVVRMAVEHQFLARPRL